MGRELAGGGLAMSGQVADNAAAGFVGWYRAAAAARSAILTAAGLFLLGVPLFAMHLVERALANGALDALIVTSLGVAIAVAVVIGLETAAARLAVRIGRHIDLRLGPRLLRAAVAARAAGRPASDPSADLGVIREFLAGPSLPVLVRAAWSGAYLILAVLLHPILGAVSILAAVVLVALASHAERSGPATPDDAGSAGVGATDARFAAESRLLEAIGMTARLAVSRGWYPARPVFAPVGAPGVGPLFAALLVVGGSGSALVMVDELSLGVMVGFLVLVLMALAPMSVLPWAWARVRQAAGARRRLLDIVAMEPSRPAAAMATFVGGALGEGVLSVASLNHAGEGASLKGISFELRGGQTLMVSGGTGRQRALLADLLLGLRRPDSGAVRFAGRELSDQDRAALAPYMDFVPAAGGLLAGSIRQNISRFADPPLAAVREAAAAAEIDRIIETLPDGYGTNVGGGAVDVAPGFSWRIGLARAVFGGANYVIVEVPEATVEDADLEAMVGRLRAADKIVVLFAADPPVGGPWGLLQLQPDGAVSSRASPPQALVAPPVPSGRLADRVPAITPAGPPADDPRLVVLERFLTRIRRNLTDASRPSPIVAAAQTSVDPGAYRSVLHINPIGSRATFGAPRRTMARASPVEAVDTRRVAGGPAHQAPKTGLAGPTLAAGAVVLAGAAAVWLWATWAMVDDTASACGQVVAAAPHHVLTHPVGGVVLEILVSEGDQVRSGDVLLRFGPAAAQQERADLEGRQLAAVAALARLEAERQGRAEISFPDDLLAAMVAPPPS